MNRRKNNQVGKSELLVKEVIFPGRRDEAGTSQCSKDLSLGDYKGETTQENAVGASVKIGDHEVKAVGGLKLLEKKPLENYFGGTKEKKHCKRKAKVKRVIYHPNDFGCDVPESVVKDAGIATKDSSKEDIREEVDEDKRLLLEVYKYQKMRECDNRRNHTLQRLAEENYIEELENLAETWEEYKKRRYQLEQSGDFSCLQHPPRKILAKHSRIGFSIISKKYWKDDEDPVSVPREDKKEEIRKASESTQQQSNYGELGEELLKKLVFVYDEDNEESAS